MHFTTLAISALSIGSAIAQQSGVKVHVVRVGSMNGSNTFYPEELTADVGDMVQFQFAPGNHTVTQSTFDQPCQPMAMNSNTTGIYSGFMPVAANAQMSPTWTVMVRAKTPMWMYCSQARHCQSGMTMVLNAPANNPARTLSSFKALARQATANLPGTATSGGTDGSTGGGAGGSGTGTDGGSATGAPDADASAPASEESTNAGNTQFFNAKGAAGMGCLLALGMALLV